MHKKRHNVIYCVHYCMHLSYHMGRWEKIILPWQSYAYSESFLLFSPSNHIRNSDHSSVICRPTCVYYSLLKTPVSRLRGMTLSVAECSFVSPLFCQSTVSRVKYFIKIKWISSLQDWCWNSLLNVWQHQYCIVKFNASWQTVAKVLVC